MSAKPPPPPPPPPKVPSSSGAGAVRAQPAPSRVLTGLRCSSCGGTVEVREGLTNVECRYCSTPQAVVGARGIVRLMVLDRLDREAAGAAVRSWLTRGIRKDPALKREARPQESFIAWFPFVRARLDAVGWVLGIRETRRKRGNRWETVREPVERQIEREVDLTVPAADMAEFGVYRVDLGGDAIEPLDEQRLRGRGMVFRPSRSLQEAAAAMSEQALAEVARSQRLDHVSFSWLAAIRRRVALVYYPLWVVRYDFRGRTYQVLVDAEDGSIAYGKAPGNHLYRAASLVATCAAASFVGTTVLQHAGAFLRSENGLMGLGLLGLALAGIVYWGYRQFRHGGVVEEGSGVAADRAPSSLAATVTEMVKGFQ